MAKKSQKSGLHLFEGWTFTRKNYLIFGIGVVVIIIGYIVMTTGEVNSFQSLTLAPILLFVGYVVIIPIALIYRKKSKKSLGS
ncbi:MAG: DUF3098 domain-containing protein [Candidatus Marinimicrobia bacterium]|nr:DUF3098 domain-containing protein [Candidatus Neomarinimicrobiota bacterium]MBL7046609.1 DUF3098 domain-containing protein [Candidatus Neomarinimicrobiota bacterium]